jgi:uncharacterized membrane protein YgaE (UPF0421/DUF939 family)
MLLLKNFTNKWIGHRVLKTGVAVFLTAAVCNALGFPAVFAVITAIVTLEPTASDSIKKGLVRFPASAIGAALAVFFVSVLGPSPLTFALAATLTIYICQKLRLEQGTLVAALTSVAMIPDVHDHFFLAFLTRLGTTTIGLTVSTLINLLLLPPDYTGTVSERMKIHKRDLADLLTKTVNQFIDEEHFQHSESHKKDYSKLRKNIDRSEELIIFQKKEWKYHRFRYSDYRNLADLEKQLHILQRAVLHLGNLQYVHVDAKAGFNDYEKKLLSKSAGYMAYYFGNLEGDFSDSYYHTINEVDQYLKYDFTAGQKKSGDYFHHFHAKTVIFYELLSIHDTLEELHQQHSKNLKRKGNWARDGEI